MADNSWLKAKQVVAYAALAAAAGAALAALHVDAVDAAASGAALAVGEDLGTSAHACRLTHACT